MRSRWGNRLKMLLPCLTSPATWIHQWSIRTSMLCRHRRGNCFGAARRLLRCVSGICLLYAREIRKRKNFKTQQLPISLDLSLRKTWSEITWLSWRHRKRKAGVFKFFPFEERFRKLCFRNGSVCKKQTLEWTVRIIMWENTLNDGSFWQYFENNCLT